MVVLGSLSLEFDEPWILYGFCQRSPHNMIGHNFQILYFALLEANMHCKVFAFFTDLLQGQPITARVKKEYIFHMDAVNLNDYGCKVAQHDLIATGPTIKINRMWSPTQNCSTIMYMACTEHVCSMSQW